MSSAADGSGACLYADNVVDGSSSWWIALTDDHQQVDDQLANAVERDCTSNKK